MSESGAQKIRGLTRRGYRREDKQVATVEELPFNTAPDTFAIEADPESWGRSQDECRAMLRRQMCPICGEGPWKSPLNHASRKHGVDRFTMRDTCGITTTESVTEPSLHETFSQRELTPATAAAMSASRKSHGAEKRLTSAGRKALIGNLSGARRSRDGKAS